MPSNISMHLLAVAGAVYPSLAEKAVVKDSPIAKVIELLTNMQASIAKEGDDAQKVFKEFSEWCEDRSRNVGFEIKTAKADINDLQATIANAASNILAANAEIEHLTGSITANEADLKAAVDIRNKEEADFKMEAEDLVDTVSVIERAVGILEREMRKGTATMLQIKQSNDVVKALKIMVDASMLPLQDAKRLTALVQNNQQQQQQEDDDDELPGAPAAAAYVGRSNGIIDTLEDLLDKAKEQLDACRKKEVNQKHNFKMLEQSLKDEMKFGGKELEAAKKELSGNGATKANAEGELQVTSTGLKEDIKTKETLHSDCLEGAQDFEAATKSRGEELNAIAQAKKIIQETTSGSDGLQYGLDQTAESFLQTSEVMHSSADLVHFEAVQFVRDLARKNQDSSLALLAKRMGAMLRSGEAAGEDPFVKVKGLIRDMIMKLEKQSNVDATQKAYCDKEMGETSQKLVDKNAAVSKISTEIDSMTARSAQLKEDVAALHKALADILSAQVSMDKIRSEEHELYTQSNADMQQGLNGIKMAMKVLRDYYAKEGDAAPAHGAAEGSANSVIGLLEVVESDLTKGMAEMNVEETTSQSEYERITQEQKISQATKGQSVKYKTKEMKGLDSRVAESRSDLQTTSEELAAVQEYDAKIKQMCVAKPETYAQRAARRQAEIAGLKEALQILRSETAESSAFLQKKPQVLRAVRRA